MTAVLETKPSRLVSLDAFRGLVICAMLIVNNLGDSDTTGYFWKHADWREGFFGPSFSKWWGDLVSGAAPIHTVFTQFPAFRHCTLADFVMPGFLLIIGLAMPFSVAASRAKGLSFSLTWLRVIKRAAMLVVLGWILCYFRDQFAAYVRGQKPFTLSLGMDVLQLLGVAYLVARILYELPAPFRAGAVALLYLWHWALLRFLTQGDIPAGTFTHDHNAVGYVYANIGVWGVKPLSWLSISWAGMLSVPPAAATMLIGTLAADHLRRLDVAITNRLRNLVFAGLILMAVGFAWAFDLPFNKPRWTPCYLLWTSGIYLILQATLYWLIDVRGVKAWTYPLVVLGVNAIGIYFISIMAKVLFMNLPRVNYKGDQTNLTNAIILWLKDALGSAWIGGWAFTILFVAFWWMIAAIAYRKRIVWKI